MKSSIDAVIEDHRKSNFFIKWVHLYNQKNGDRKAVSNLLSAESHAGYYGFIGRRVIEDSLMEWYEGGNEKHLKKFKPMKWHDVVIHVLLPEVVCRLIQEDVKKHDPTIQLSLEDAYIIMKESAIYGQIMFGDN